MSMWKLPRKRKKAFIARYGRGWYRMRVLISSAEDVEVSIDEQVGNRTMVLAQRTESGVIRVLHEALVPNDEPLRFSGWRRTRASALKVYYDGVNGPATEWYVPRDWMMRIPGNDPAMLPTAPGLGEFINDMTGKQFFVTTSPTPPPPSPLMAKLLPLRNELARAQMLGDSLAALELQETIVGTIEREAERETTGYRMLNYILVDREPVALADPAIAQLWSQYATDRVVASDDLPDGIRVSTVFLMVDHSYGNGAPVLFETMVFGGPMDREQQRYHTWAEAEAGHRVWVAKHFEV